MPQAVDGTTRRAGEAGGHAAQPHPAGKLTAGAAVPQAAVSRRAFSLAELMIALAILAMGLLVIGAALPVGFRYTRDSINLASGEAAAHFGLDLLQQKLCIHRKAMDRNGTPRCEPGLFVPRRGESSPPEWSTFELGEFVPDYEPIVKVRPLFTQNISATPGPTYGQEIALPPWGQGVVLTEAAIRNWLKPADLDGELLEVDLEQPILVRPPLPSVAMVYPPVTADITQYPDMFFAGPYYPNPVLTPPNGRESVKALERRVAWTAFYRRVLYADPNNPASVGDPTLYEFIAVSVRVPDADQHFPSQHPDDAGDYLSAGVAPLPQSGGSALNPGYFGEDNYDLAAPVPWLVTFSDPLPAPPGGFDMHGNPLLADNWTPVAAQPPPTLTFKCSARRDPLFPVGTMFIPARNDVAPHALRTGGDWKVGFGPPTTNLPLFEVVTRPDPTTVVVKYNGFYPRASDDVQQIAPAAGAWPVWVIPPAARRDSSGNVLWSNQSSILAVARRFVRLPEVP